MNVLQISTQIKKQTGINRSKNTDEQHLNNPLSVSGAKVEINSEIDNSVTILELFRKYIT